MLKNLKIDKNVKKVIALTQLDDYHIEFGYKDLGKLPEQIFKDRYEMYLTGLMNRAK